MNNIKYIDKFNERARKVLSLAQEEAQNFQHDAVGTEHMLLGLVREGESITAHVLEALGVTLERLRKAVEEVKKRGSGSGSGNALVQGEIGRTLDADAALAMAMKEAERQFPSPSTGTEPPLRGSTYIDESEAVKIVQDGQLPDHLASLGVTLEEVRKALEEAQGRGVQLVIDQRLPINTPTGEAERRRHPFFRVDTEHLFLGLLRVPESTGVKVLQGLGVPPLKDIRTLLFLEHVTTLPLTNKEYSPCFTRQAREAWRLAQEESRRLQDGYVGAHHLLLGLIGEGSGIAATVLAEMGVDQEKMRAQVKPGYTAGDWSVPSDIPLTPMLKYIIEHAANEARRLYYPSIGTGHLLLALVRGPEDEGIEAGLLKRLGVDLDKLRARLRRVLAEKTSALEQEAEAISDEGSEEGTYASNATIASIERGLQSRELDKTFLAVYPFTLEARSVLESAWIQARGQTRTLDQRVGPEHLLLGLTFSHEGPARKVLKDVGIDFARVQDAIQKRQGQEVKAASVVLVESTLCRAYLLLAADEAENRDGRGSPIKSEHLLLGLLREEKGIIADLLTDLDTSVPTLRTKLLESMSDEASD